MALSAGTTLGVYEIVALLGADGMSAPYVAMPSPVRESCEASPKNALRVGRG